jgi:hypothetical protein
MRRLVLAVVCLSLAVLTTSAAAQKPAVADVLKSAADYLTDFAQKLGAVAADEEYTQREPAGNVNRRLVGDIVWVGFDGGAIGGFRDIHGMDGHQLRQRDDRLLKLLAKPSEASQEEARALQNEGMRHYISPNLRAMDQPMLALEFLRAANHQHSEFELDGGVKTQDGVQVQGVKWKTKNASAVWPVPEGLSANGKATIEVGSGAIRSTEVVISNKVMMAKLIAKYAPDKALGLLLPTEMIQTIDISSSAGTGMSQGGVGAKQSLEGRARYSKFRRAN